VHVRSLTKAAAPGLRVSAVVARGPAAARLRPTRIVDGALVPGALQEAAVELVTAPGWTRHLSRTRTALRERRDALHAAVEAELGPGRVAGRPRGGMHLWVQLDAGEDDVALADRAARAGVIVSPGRPYFPAEPAGSFLRVTYAGEPPDRLAAGVRLLASARRQ
jgi:DNA-binding transcriptional MocR family regulator